VGIESRSHLPPGRAAADAHDPALGVDDLDGVQVRQVDHHPAGVRAVAERTVAAGPHRHRKIEAYGVGERGRDLVRVSGADDQRRFTGREEHPRRVVVPVVPGSQRLEGQVGLVQAHRSLLVRRVVRSITGFDRWGIRAGPRRPGGGSSGYPAGGSAPTRIPRPE